MATKVVLTADVPGLGKRDTVASVKDGYAHNYLFRKNLAKPYSDAARAELAAKAEAAGQQRELEDKLARAAKAQIEKLHLRFTLTLNGQDKAFGSVNAAQVLSELERNHVQVARSALGDVRLDVGEHELEVKLTDAVRAALKVSVKGEKGER